MQAEVVKRHARAVLRTFLLVLVFLLGLASGSAISHASEPLTSLPGCSKDISASEFSALLAKYPSVFHDSTKSLAQWDLEGQITTAVFCQVGNPRYVKYLQTIDAISHSDQEAYYNLAKRLQAHWESQYAVGLSKIQKQRMKNATDISRQLSVLAMALGMFGKTSAVPQYFYVIRELFPVLLPGMTAESVSYMNKRGMLDNKFPLSPAHVMKLPLPAENQTYDTFEITRDVTAATASVAGAQLAIKAVKYFDIGTTIGKTSFNPVTIVASVLVGQLVQDGTAKIIDGVQYERLQSHFLQALANVEDSFDQNDNLRLRTSAEDFKTAAIMLSSYLDRESLDAWVQYDKDVADVHSDPLWKEIAGVTVEFYTGLTPKYFFPDGPYMAEEVTKAAKERDMKLAAIAASQDPESTRDVELEIALNILRSTRDPSVLNGEQESQAALISQGYNIYLKSHSPILGDTSRNYEAYLRALQKAKDAMLAQELRSGIVHRNATEVLLQAAAFIRSLHTSALDGIRDDLLNIVFSGELLK